MVSLKNSHLSVTLDEKGRIVELVNHLSGGRNVIARPVALFHTIIQNGTNWEEVAYAEDAELTVSAENDTATVHVTAMNTRQSHLDIEMKLTITLSDDRLIFGAEINNATDKMITDFSYPCIGAIKSLGAGALDLLYPAGFGELRKNIAAQLRNLVGRDTKMLLSGIYPFTQSMQCMMLLDRENCMYLGMHDPQLRVLSMLALGSESDDVTLKMNKMIFVKGGERWKGPEAVLWLYRGAWQKGAEYYRSWLNTVIADFGKSSWLEDSNGMLNVVAKQAFGSQTWPYDKLPRLYDIAKQHGCDTVCYYGAFFSDHRDLVGDIEPIEAMGGTSALCDSIRQIHADGGRVVLHYPGHRMEMNGPYYPTIGKRLESKNHWGNPYHEQFTSPASSSYLRTFGERSSAVICPGCGEWHELLSEKAKQIKSLGADGVIFDEVKSFQHYVHGYISAMMPYPCFAPEHSHSNPSSSFAEGRRVLLSRLSDDTKALGDFALIGECASDAFMPYLNGIRGNASHSSGSERDCAHSGGATPSSKGGRAGVLKSGAAVTLNMPELFRHTFPEVIASMSNYLPYLQPRLVNYAVCYGFRFSLSIMTQLDKQFIERNEYTDWQEYAKAACALRRKHSKLLLKGAYSCSEPLAAANPSLHHGVFKSDTDTCVVFWNDSDDAVSIAPCGMKVISWETVNESGDGLPSEIEGNSIVVLFVEQ